MAQVYEFSTLRWAAVLGNTYCGLVDNVERRVVSWKHLDVLEESSDPCCLPGCCSGRNIFSFTCG